jgi:hypothetical protein
MSLSVITGGPNGGGDPTTSSTLNSSIGIGQVVLAFVQGGTIPAGTTVSDNVNTGNYLLLGDYPAENMAIYWIITNAIGTPTVTLAQAGFSFIWVMGVTGFVGTPTSDTAIQATATGTSTTPTLAAASNFANEIMLMNVGITYSQAVTATGWTKGTTGAGNGFNAFYAIEAVPTTNNFNGTWGTSQQWFLQLAGIYDLPATNVASIAWVS